MFGGTCIVADRLIILPRDGQSRAVIDAAAARYGGFGVPFYSARADIYAIDFPSMVAVELDRIREKLISDGFDASLSYMAELFGSSSIASTGRLRAR